MQPYIWFPYTADVKVEYIGMTVIDVKNDKGEVVVFERDVLDIQDESRPKTRKQKHDSAKRHSMGDAFGVASTSPSPAMTPTASAPIHYDPALAAVESARFAATNSDLGSAAANSLAATGAPSPPTVNIPNNGAEAQAASSAATVIARQALRHILYSSLRDGNLRNVLDGCLLPPPLRHPDLNDPDGSRPYTRAEVVEAARRIPRELVPMLVSVPLNFALTTGVYDARLRATMKRLAHLLEYPIEGIFAKEEMLANLDVTELAQVEAEGMRATIDSTGLSVTVKRIALISAVTVVGAVALFISGGIAAPIVGPAFTTLVNAIAASIGAAGALGTMLLSGTALAGIFTALIGAAGHTAAFAIIAAPYLSAGKITAIFGVAGASLSAYKAKKRFGGLEEFSIRSVDEVERLPEMDLGKEDPKDVKLDGLVETSKRLHETESKSLDDDMTGESMKGYVVPTNVRTRALMNMANAVRFTSRRYLNPCAVENRLHKSVKLELAAVKLTLGVWGHVPPHNIPSDSVGMFLSHNRPNYPTGSHGYICYRIACVDKVALTPAMRGLLGATIWISVGVSFGMTVTLGCVVKLAAECPLNEHRKQKEKYPGEYLRRMLFELDVESHSPKDFVQRLGPLEVEGRLRPKPHVIVRMLPEEGTDSNGRTLLSYFHEKELDQQVADVKELVDPKTHRAVFAVIKNSMTTPIDLAPGGSSALQFMGVKTVAGNTLTGFVAPKALPVRHACIIPYVHQRKSMFSGGAEMEVILMGESRALSVPDRPESVPTVLEGAPHSDATAATATPPPVAVPTLPPNYFINLRAKVSLTNSLSGTALVLTTMRPPTSDLRSPSTKGAPSNTEAEGSSKLRHKDHECCRESPFARVKISFDADNYAVIFEILDPLTPNLQAQEEGSILKGLKSLQSKRSMTLTIAATGYTTVFDPRIPNEDQQVMIWQKPLAECELFNKSEQFVLQWEEEQQSYFYGVVGQTAEQSAAEYASDNTKESIIKETKSRLMHTALFTFLSSYRTLISVFDFPMYVVWASDAIDNSFATLRNRSKLAGRELASALLSPERGNRPVTLTGFSFGANVIFECLLVLYEANALAIVEDVYLLGACLDTDRDKWRKARQAVGGRLVNVYNRGDLTLRIFHRSNSIGHRPPAGLAQVALPGIENINISAEISAHGGYAMNLTRLLGHIPPTPTPESCKVSTSGSAVGACVPASEILNAADNVIEAMHSRLCLDEGFILSYTNRVVADGLGRFSKLGGDKKAATYGPESHTGDVSFVFVGEVCFGCQFDFSPPPAVSTGDAGVSGVLFAQRSQAPCCVAGFAAQMTSLSETILVVLSFTVFDSEKKEVFGACKAIIVPEYAYPGEDAIELGERLQKIVESYAPNAAAVRKAAITKKRFTSVVEVPIKELIWQPSSSAASSMPSTPGTAGSHRASFGNPSGVGTPRTMTPRARAVSPRSVSPKAATPYASIVGNGSIASFAAATTAPKAMLKCPIKIAWTYKGNHFTWAASGILTRDPSLLELIPSESDDNEEEESRELDPLYREFLASDIPSIGKYLDADSLGTMAEVLPLAGMHQAVVQLRKALCTPPANLSGEPAESARLELAAACGRSKPFTIEGMALKPIIKNIGTSPETSILGRSRLGSSYPSRARMGRSCPTNPLHELGSSVNNNTINNKGPLGCSPIMGRSLQVDVLGMTKGERFEAALAAVQRRTVTVVQPLVIANCSVKKVPLCLPTDTQSLLSAAEGLQWLRVPPPLIGAGQCTMLAFRWRVDPYSVFKGEVDRVMRPVSSGAPPRKVPTSCSLLLSTFSLGELVGKSPEPVGRSTYIVRIIATLTCPDFITNPNVTTSISVSCLVDTFDEQHRRAVSCFASPLQAIFKDGLEEMQYQCISIPAGGAKATSAEEHNDYAWKLFK